MLCEFCAGSIMATHVSYHRRGCQHERREDCTFFSAKMGLAYHHLVHWHNLWVAAGTDMFPKWGKWQLPVAVSSHKNSMGGGEAVAESELAHVCIGIRFLYRTCNKRLIMQIWEVCDWHVYDAYWGPEYTCIAGLLGAHSCGFYLQHEVFSLQFAFCTFT